MRFLVLQAILWSHRRSAYVSIRSHSFAARQRESPCAHYGLHVLMFFDTERGDDRQRE